MIITLGTYLSLAAVLFGIGAAGFLTRRNLLLQLRLTEFNMISIDMSWSKRLRRVRKPAAPIPKRTAASER